MRFKQRIVLSVFLIGLALSGMVVLKAQEISQEPPPTCTLSFAFTDDDEIDVFISWSGGYDQRHYGDFGNGDTFRVRGSQGTDTEDERYDLDDMNQGTFTVTFTVDGPGGSYTCETTVNFGGNPASPSATATPISPPTCALSFAFTDDDEIDVFISWSGGYDQRHYGDFGNGYTFDVNGAQGSETEDERYDLDETDQRTYPVSFTVNGPGGSFTCNLTITFALPTATPTPQPVATEIPSIEPTCELSLLAQNGNQIELEVTVIGNGHIDFGDGSNSSVSFNIPVTLIHTYPLMAESREYVILLNVDGNENPCSLSINVEGTVPSQTPGSIVPTTVPPTQASEVSTCSIATLAQNPNGQTTLQIIWQGGLDNEWYPMTFSQTEESWSVQQIIDSGNFFAPGPNGTEVIEYWFITDPTNPNYDGNLSFRVSLWMNGLGNGATCTTQVTFNIQPTAIPATAIVVTPAFSTPVATAYPACPSGTGPGGITAGDYPPERLTQDQRQWLYTIFGHSGSASAGYGGERCGQSYDNSWDNFKAMVCRRGDVGPGGIIAGSYDPQSLSQEQRNWLYHQFGNTGEASQGYGGEHCPNQTENYTVEYLHILQVCVSGAVGPYGMVPGSYNPQDLNQDERNWLYHIFGYSGEAPAGFGGNMCPDQSGNYSAPDRTNPYNPAPRECPNGVGEPGTFDPQSLTQQQRNELYGAFGHSGEAPVGYGGEHCYGGTMTLPSFQQDQATPVSNNIETPEVNVTEEPQPESTVEATSDVGETPDLIWCEATEVSRRTVFELPSPDVEIYFQTHERNISMEGVSDVLVYRGTQPLNEEISVFKPQEGLEGEIWIVRVDILESFRGWSLLYRINADDCVNPPESFHNP